LRPFISLFKKIITAPCVFVQAKAQGAVLHFKNDGKNNFLNL